MTHEELCERARRWLSGTRRCDPVYSRNASCQEIPDAIGWASVHRQEGSTVVECKASLSDFRADKGKYLRWIKEESWGRASYPYSRFDKKWAIENGYQAEETSRMGDFRFYMCLKGVIAAEAVPEDHGLIYVLGKRRIEIVKDAPRRKYETVDKDSEIRYLRFAIINGKVPYVRPEEMPAPQLFDAVAQS